MLYHNPILIKFDNKNQRNKRRGAHLPINKHTIITNSSNERYEN